MEHERNLFEDEINRLNVKIEDNERERAQMESEIQ
jgi:hypothetical protein